MDFTHIYLFTFFLMKDEFEFFSVYIEQNANAYSKIFIYYI